MTPKNEASTRLAGLCRRGGCARGAAAVESAPGGRDGHGRIADVMLFGREAQPRSEIYVSRIWLE